MNECSARNSFLIRGMKEKFESDVFDGLNFHQSLFGQVCGSPPLLHTAGTIRKQLGKRYANATGEERSEFYGDFGTD
jgi:hypothetical protein